MTLIASSNPSIEAVSAVIIPPIVAIMAEDIDPLAPCLLNSDGEIEMSNGTTVGATSAFIGVAARGGLAGQPGSLYGVGTQFEWDDQGGLTPGAPYFIGTTDGTIDDTATTADNLGSFMAITAKVLVVTAIRNLGVAVVA